MILQLVNVFTSTDSFKVYISLLADYSETLNSVPPAQAPTSEWQLHKSVIFN